MKCSFDLCDKAASSKAGFGLCVLHYGHKKSGLPLSVVPYRINSYKGKKCSFDNCKNNARAGGLCGAHYQQRRNNKELYPLLTRRKPHKGSGCRIVGCEDKHNAHGMCLNHYTIFHVHGIEPELYERMFVEQDNVCAICRQKCVSRRRLSVDHCHDTGAIRGLLCAKCNRAIGLLGDDPALLDAAAAYLRKTRMLRKVA